MVEFVIDGDLAVTKRFEKRRFDDINELVLNPIPKNVNVLFFQKPIFAIFPLASVMCPFRRLAIEAPPPLPIK